MTRTEMLDEVADKLGTLTSKDESDGWHEWKSYFAALIASEMTRVGAQRLLERVTALEALE